MRAWLAIGLVAAILFSAGAYVGVKLTEPTHFTFLPPNDPGIPPRTPTPLPRADAPLPDQIDT